MASTELPLFMTNNPYAEVAEPVEPPPAVKEDSGASPPASLRYTMEHGETLHELSQRYQIPLPQLLAANPSLAGNPNLVRAGKTLTIPLGEHGGVTPHLALPEPGQTLAELTEAHGVPLALVRAANRHDLRGRKDGALPEIVYLPQVHDSSAANSLLADDRPGSRPEPGATAQEQPSANAASAETAARAEPADTEPGEAEPAKIALPAWELDPVTAEVISRMAREPNPVQAELPKVPFLPWTPESAEPAPATPGEPTASATPDAQPETSPEPAPQALPEPARTYDLSVAGYLPPAASSAVRACSSTEFRLSPSLTLSVVDQRIEPDEPTEEGNPPPPSP